MQEHKFIRNIQIMFLINLPTQNKTKKYILEQYKPSFNFPLVQKIIELIIEDMTFQNFSHRNIEKMEIK